MQMIKNWFNVLMLKTKPSEIVQGAELGKGLMEWVKASVVVGIILLIAMAIGGSALISLIPGMGMLGPLMGAVGIVAGIMAMIGLIIGGIVGIIVTGILLHIFSLIVGGKGNFSKYIGAIAHVEAAILGSVGLIAAILTLIGAIAFLAGPLVGAMVMLILTAIIGLIGLIAVLIQLYIMIMVTREEQKLSTGRAVIAVIVIPFIILIILTMLGVGLGIAALTAGPGMTTIPTSMM